MAYAYPTLADAVAAGTVLAQIPAAGLKTAADLQAAYTVEGYALSVLFPPGAPAPAPTTAPAPLPRLTHGAFGAHMTTLAAGQAQAGILPWQQVLAFVEQLIAAYLASQGV